MGRSAFVVRREGRYLFRTRWPRCLVPAVGSASIRIALGTAAYPVALRRASRIASWAMRIKAAETPEQAISELNAVLHQMADRPVMDEDDLVARLALQRIAFSVCARLRASGRDPDKLAPQFPQACLAFQEETCRAAEVLSQPNGQAPWSGAGRLVRVSEDRLPALPGGTDRAYSRLRAVGGGNDRRDSTQVGWSRGAAIAAFRGSAAISRFPRERGRRPARGK